MVDKNDARDILFGSSGTGLAPITAILDDLYREGTKRRITLLHGMRYSSHIEPYYPYFEEYARSNPDFTFVPVVSREPEWEGERGHVQDVLKQREAEDKLKMEFSPERTVVYICGLPGMVQDVADFFTERGFKTEREARIAGQKADIIIEKY